MTKLGNIIKKKTRKWLNSENQEVEERRKDEMNQNHTHTKNEEL